MKINYGIHWFRRDLRVAGNKALKENWKRSDGKVLGIFCFDKKFLSRDDMSFNRFQLFIDSLVALKEELQTIGSDLLVLDVGPQEAFKGLFKKISENNLSLPSHISFNRDYEPFAKKRDAELTKIFEDHKIDYFHHRDHLLIEPHELSKGDKEGSGYQVYSPFARKWLELFKSNEIQVRLQEQKKGLEYFEKYRMNKIPKIFSYSWGEFFGDKITYPKTLELYSKENQKKVTIAIPKAGSHEAFKLLENYVSKLDSYGEDRDFPGLEGTSKLSMYLKNGSVTVPQIIAYLNLKPYSKKSSSRDVFFSELIWREFYYHILDRHPRVEKEAFLTQYKSLEWENNKEYFEHWKKGTTGFPIVDAGMRQLKTTGWMHNRVRMIVASFLTKDLLINWQWGEKYFMDQLLDGDLAPNNGGWQWAASTGCDPQPYFRIFNPWLQSKRFDKEGEYIKAYLPELKNLPAKALHEPIHGHATYPSPIVEHSEQRNKALDMYKKARG